MKGLRALPVARRSAMKAHTQAALQIRDLVITAPDGVRGQLAGLGTAARVQVCARFRPGEVSGPAGATRPKISARSRRPRPNVRA